MPDELAVLRFPEFLAGDMAVIVIGGFVWGITNDHKIHFRHGPGCPGPIDSLMRALEPAHALVKVAVEHPEISKEAITLAEKIVQKALEVAPKGVAVAA